MSHSPQHPFPGKVPTCECGSTGFTARYPASGTWVRTLFYSDAGVDIESNLDELVDRDPRTMRCVDCNRRRPYVPFLGAWEGLEGGTDDS